MAEATRNPLVLPPSEATPEDLESQERYRSSKSAFDFLKAFAHGNSPTAVDVFRHVASPVVTDIIGLDGDSSVDTIHALWLSHLSDASDLVVFCSSFLDTTHPTTGNARYGILDPDERILREFVLENVYSFATANEVCSAAAILATRKAEAKVKAEAPLIKAAKLREEMLAIPRR